jgi:protein pelota
MKLLEQDKKSQKYRLQLENEDDLWHLYHLIETGDSVSSLTQRREKELGDRLRPGKEKKRTMVLGIEVESVEFHDFSGRLRILGVIREGPQDLGSHHTLVMEPGSRLSIIKPLWRPSHLKLLKDSLASGKHSPILFVSLDMDEALVVKGRYYGMEELASIASGRSGKQFQGRSAEDFFRELSSVLLGVPGELPILILGPGFTKENFHEYLKEKNRPLFSRCSVFSTGQSGKAGINELLKKGTASGHTKKLRLQFELERVEAFMTELGKNSGLAAYGPVHLQKALTMGALEELLVCDQLLSQLGRKSVEEKTSEGNFPELERLMESVERQAGAVHIISKGHDGGRQLMAFGGLGALLRYPLGN